MRLVLLVAPFYTGGNRLREMEWISPKPKLKPRSDRP